MPTTFSITHRVQFSETDMAGVVHFSSFFKWMEEVEHAFFRSVGLSVAMQHEGGGAGGTGRGGHIGWPRVKAACEYTGPVRFEDEVDCRMTVTRIGEKSFSYDVAFAVRGAPVAAGSVTSVCCAIEAGGAAGGTLRAIPIPPDVRAKLAGG